MDDEVRISANGSSIEVDKQLLKKQGLLKERARYYVAIGEPRFGRQLLEGAIRKGGWLKIGLWWELVATISDAEDYQRLRWLWLSSPPECHKEASILRAMARAACISGFHAESRTLLRKAILITSAQSKGKTAISAALASVKRNLRRGVGGVNGEDATESFPQKAAEALFDLNLAFSRLGLKAFLISGTLLGLIREGRIIGWDKDIDVGVFSEDRPSDLEGYFRRDTKFRLGRVDLSSDRLRLIHTNGTWIDVFPHYLEGDKRWHDGSATRWWNTPFALKAMSFLGSEHYVPENPELYLEENYGHWRIPRADFDARLDAPNVEITDREHFVTLLFFSLESSIRKGKTAMKDRYVKLLHEEGENGWLDRL